jgi:hypothetical protein
MGILDVALRALTHVFEFGGGAQLRVARRGAGLLRRLQRGLGERQLIGCGFDGRLGVGRWL